MGLIVCLVLLRAGGAPTATNSAGAGNVPTAGSVKIDGANSTTALAGTIAATKISANTKTGFSIVEYVGNATAGATVGHGLSSPIEFIITKNTNDGTENWNCWQTGLTGNGYRIVLNSSDAEDGTSPTVWNNNINPTSTTFTIGSGAMTNGSGNAIIAYCFHSVSGYQRVGSYTGTGLDTGNYIYTDSNGDGTGTGAFEPAFLLVKRTDLAADWFIYDNKRMYGREAPANPLDGELRANRDLAEDNYPGYNFYTNGFEVANNGTNMNADGGNYIYLAIAADKDSSVPTLANSFSPTTYTGTSAALNIATPFAPDWTWIKSTTIASSHGLYDTIRGGAKWITSNGTNSNQDTPTALQKFNPNGFTLGDDSGAWGVNNSKVEHIFHGTGRQEGCLL